MVVGPFDEAMLILFAQRAVGLTELRVALIRRAIRERR
jgi:hypothetical protein